MRQREEQIEENGIDLLEILAVLLDKVWIIILVGVLTAGAAFGYTKFMVTPISGDHTGICIDKGRRCGGDVRGLEPQ